MIETILSTVDPISVLPEKVQRVSDLDIQPEPQWKGDAPDWRGAACNVGRLKLQWMYPGQPPQYKPFDLLVLSPKGEDPPDTLPYIHLGAQFFVEFRAQLDLNFTYPNSPTGKIVVP